MQKLLTPKTVAELSGLTVGKLAKLRCTGDGPEFIKMGPNTSRVYYEETAVDVWLASKRRRSTSDTGEVSP